MTTTTFDSVRGGTSQPAETPAAKPAKGKGKQKAAPVATPKATPKAASNPARKPGTITIEGKGTIPVHIDGAMRRLPKGEPIKVSDAELAFIKGSGVKFS